ncbi:DUF5134 domain-containing protein [Kitasatospora sp. NPDC093806]|uniref:DUF5134 domain-containing protein n=1 Tax=Kitasatospora sp. NPDC093806 TaxID=3155075 RepID=UPI0034391280
MVEPVIATVLLIALSGWCALHCVLVIAGRRYAERRLEAAEIVMALAMVAMLVPAFDPLPPAVWAALLTAAAVWPVLLLAGSAGRAGSLRHCLHHVLGAAAMAALVLSTAPGAQGHHHAGAAVPRWMLLALAGYFLAYVARGARAVLVRPAGGSEPALVAARRTVMATGMFYMLVAMG